jgi:hypothetical protein
MTVVRIYVLIWLLVLGAAGVSYLTGTFSEITLTIFGFVFSSLVFMGFVAVLPALLDDHFSPKTYLGH